LKRVHLIAIGGAVMHNLAIALKQKGYVVSGSDDAIYDPSKTRLAAYGLLPDKMGWDETRITEEIDQVILGMHARKDNPEMAKALELGIPVVSFPEFVAAEAKDKKRVVIAGSHGKTTTTAMLMYVLHQLDVDFDYLVGSSVDGFEVSVKLSDAPLILIEGDEYLSSPLDLKSKFLWYHPHISIITGIAYDHINVFPTFELYVDTFRAYIATHQPGKYFWYKNDEELQQLSANTNVENKAYDTPNYVMRDGKTVFLYEDKQYPLSIIGEHNLQNLHAALLVGLELGISADAFLNAAADFTGAGKRMEKLFEDKSQVVFRDFAHSPSKLQATVNAVKKAYDHPLLAVFELHTFSSLNKAFLPYYKDTMKEADRAIVYFHKDVFEHKKMEVLSKERIKQCFGDVEVLDNAEKLEEYVENAFAEKYNILLMSSGTFKPAKFSFN
jgi:UDP-N-acetylmuramate: L-alanyl-gamma-D-glutamyl-meso-diaminopimelate ligase